MKRLYIAPDIFHDSTSGCIKWCWKILPAGSRAFERPTCPTIQGSRCECSETTGQTALPNKSANNARINEHRALERTKEIEYHLFGILRRKTTTGPFIPRTINVEYNECSYLIRDTVSSSIFRVSFIFERCSMCISPMLEFISAQLPSEPIPPRKRTTLPSNIREVNP